jgi:hypothetical protein
MTLDFSRAMLICSVFSCAMSVNACATSSKSPDAAQGTIDAMAGTTDASINKPDAATPPDAKPAPSPLGAECTGQGQGSCAAGYECLNLQGASGSWCSKICVEGAGDTCDQGYTGAGVGSCLLTVTPAGGGAGQLYCAIICQDEPGAPTLCAPSTRCDSTCPTPLVCTNNLTTSAGALVGKTCQ